MSEPARSAAAIDPIELAAELIRRPSVTPKDEGAGFRGLDQPADYRR